MRLYLVLGPIIFIFGAVAKQHGFDQCESNSILHLCLDLTPLLGGGYNWNGSTSCVSGYVCQKLNQYFAQCIPEATTTPIELFSRPTETTNVANDGSTCNFLGANESCVPPASPLLIYMPAPETGRGGLSTSVATSIATFKSTIPIENV